jgi:hypothetical protein
MDTKKATGEWLLKDRIFDYTAFFNQIDIVNIVK